MSVSRAEDMFKDYNRTVVGYHGTRASTAGEIVSLKATFSPSTNNDDWLGHGIYFWEHGPRNAWQWARHRYQDEEIAVIGSMIRLGNCLDLLDPENAKLLVGFHDRMVADLKAGGEKVPKNVRAKKHLDCASIEYAINVLKAEEGALVDTVRAVYVPTSGKQRLWPSSWLYHETHIQLCVRNPECILGSWLMRESPT